MIGARFLPVTIVLAALGPFASSSDCDRFRRGDADGDGEVDITDVVFTLPHLFVGDAQVSCEDAADADDTGRLTITDAIFPLEFLFRAGPAPPAPGPFVCGVDPTLDDIWEELFCQTVDSCGPRSETADQSSFARFEYRELPGPFRHGT